MLISNCSDSSPSQVPKLQILPKLLQAPKVQTYHKVQIRPYYCISVSVLVSHWRSMHGYSTGCLVDSSILPSVTKDIMKKVTILIGKQVTLGLCLIGAVPFARGGFVFIAQMLGAMASAAVVSALFPGPLAVTTSLNGGTSLAQGLFIEMFLTAQLVFTIIMLAAEKHKSTFLAPVGIGLSLFIAELGGLRFSAPLSQASKG